MRKVNLKPNSWEQSATDRVAYIGGFGTHAKPAVDVIPNVKVWNNVWLSDADIGKGTEKQKGRWKQEVSFQSTFTLSCPPSFTSDIMDVSVSTRSLCLVGD